MTNVIDFSKFKKSSSTPSIKQTNGTVTTLTPKPTVTPPPLQKVPHPPGQFAGYRAQTGYVTWLEFMTPPGYFVWIDDNEGPENDPDGGGPPRGRRWFQDHDFGPVAA